ncbi:Flp family type IVb pilin, partial [Salmonella enterica]|nr:Flp family type IVb pilin [Salmonella enterica]EDW3733106.1 Flp family type IVb pilin [Salmonella enterica]EEG0460158.1 Flp family type IVb pilin [Salmonella enterica]EFU5389506.1 Flp family type IVb pilin [Salmonella enterica]EIO0240760.1 Flp family type IVb pilin [Salmonella enterica]
MKIKDMVMKSSLKMRDFISQTNGVTAIEYALIGVAMATLLALVFGSPDDPNTLLGSLKAAFDNIIKAIKDVTVD